MVSLLSLVEGVSLREEKRGVRVWSPNSSQGFSCKSLFSLLLNPSPFRESVLNVVLMVQRLIGSDHRRSVTNSKIGLI